MTRVHLRALTFLFLGTVLMQAAWVFAVPPFRGIDEIDHAHRAAGVANGQWMPSTAAENGRGHLVVAPSRLVDAAAPECHALEYVGPDNCEPVQQLSDGNVTIASASARYNPLFYWVIGAPTQWLDGANALYGMRIIAGLLCAGFIGLAGWAISRWAQTRWPMVALLLALTPVTMYSTTISAPNGVELCASLALWVTLLGLSQPQNSPTTERALLWAALPSAVALATVRSFGPLWLGLIVLTVAAFLGVSGTVSIVRRHAGTVSVVAAIISAATVAGAWWTITAGTNALENHDNLPNPFTNTLEQIPLWFFQSIAAFPTRNEQAPSIVYATSLIVLLSLVGVGFAVSARKARVAVAVAFFVALLVPFIATVTTYSQAGAIWQGRYGLPYTFGVILLAGLALDEERLRHRLAGPALLAGCLAMSVAHVVGVTNVLVLERANSPSAGGPAWLMPAPWVVAFLMSLGWLAWGLSLRQHSSMLPTGPAEAPKVRDHNSVSA